FFSLLIITLSFIPVFTLEAQEGRLFSPLAFTKTYAMAAAAGLSVTLIPVLMGAWIRGRIPDEQKNPITRALIAAYRPLLDAVLRWPKATLVVALVALATTAWPMMRLGGEFLPRLDEGDLLYMPSALPGLSAAKASELLQITNRMIKTVPEVERVFGKAGRAETATDPAPLEMFETTIQLKPREQWRAGLGKDGLIEEMARKLEAVPGVSCNFTQPMAMRLDETISGIKADVAVKIFGEDPRILEQAAERALRVIAATPGAADEQMEIVSGVAELRVEIDRPALARYGLNVSDVRDLMEAAIGGRAISEMIEGQRRFAIVLRLPEMYRQDPDAIAGLALSAPGGERVRVGQVARVSLQRGPEVIAREDGQRRIVVQANVRGRDLGSFVAAARERMEREVKLPPGYSLTWGGQFENQERATRRLMLVVPAAILIIFGLLFATFGSVAQAILILLNVPFALVGGIAALWARGLNLNLSASVGFIALFGVAVLNGIVMVSYINRLRADGLDMDRALREGAVARLRPVLMTALVASLGFVPMAFSTSTGAEVQRPLASVVIGGLITSTMLTLFLLPALYPWFSRWDEAKNGE
ncbi:MAG TPA: CusA/CzcA family heavy metal efflux RND transporter, partial [Solibacterales bacterium]|nr:CusA/CzcA family heavy metal efflux RND transporter [Bryobacterales bacterium]